jgi:hypothetical protein
VRFTPPRAVIHLALNQGQRWGELTQCRSRPPLQPPLPPPPRTLQSSQASPSSSTSPSPGGWGMPRAFMSASGSASLQRDRT